MNESSTNPGRLFMKREFFFLIIKMNFWGKMWKIFKCVFSRSFLSRLDSLKPGHSSAALRNNYAVYVVCRQ